MGATIEFVHLTPGERYEVNGYEVTALRQRHGGDSFGYRFERGRKTVVYATDSEHKIGGPDDAAPYVAFFRDAGVLIFDGMYSLADVVSLKED